MKKEHLFSSWRQLRVSSDAPLNVVVALSVSTQVNGVWVHMDVHEVIDYLALDVVLHSVHQKTLAHVYNLDKREVPAGALDEMFAQFRHLLLYLLITASYDNIAICLKLQRRENSAIFLSYQLFVNLLLVIVIRI